MIALGLRRKPFAGPVEVHVTRILGPRQALWDTSSIGRGNWKEIEDSMVACGWFVDDSPKWITETRFFQDKTRRTQGPAIEVRILALSASDAPDGIQTCAAHATRAGAVGANPQTELF